MKSERLRQALARGHGLAGLLLVAFALSPLGCKRYDPPKGRASGLYASCCDGAGMCLPAGLIASSDAQRLAPDDCGAALLCVPREAAGGGSYVPARCDSVVGFEGRCLPSCLPELQDQLESLPSEGCAEAQRCAPCYDPITLEATGACSLGDDPGPSGPPPEVERCCGEIGRCLDATLLSESEQTRLGRDSCGADAALCVPERWLAGESVVPMSCRAVGDAEGRCLPACLPEIAQRADQLMASGCPDAHLCTPCYDLLSGESTGACEIGDDPGPSEPPKPLGHCCGDLGRCVPQSLVSDGDKDRLGVDACTAADALCVPESWLDDGPLVPETCRAPGDLEGRCLPACLPEIAQRSEQLQATTCKAGYLCAPCFDPLDGTSTRACEIGDDPGPSEPPKMLEHCCSDLGRCVPQSLVSEGDVERLGPDACTSSDALCVPESWLDEGPLVPESCRAPGDLEGRCLPACLPEITARADQLKATSCKAGYLCAPCFDPLDGTSTRACEIGDDPGPIEPSKVLEHCCSGLGRCVPQSLVTSDDKDRLGTDACSSADALCVPESWLDDGPLVPKSCRAPGDLEGRCLPACLPEIADRAGKLEVASCDGGHLCAPCFDPLSGESTGACDLGDDPGPKDPPVTFGNCCQDRGRCVPRSLVIELASESDADQLGTDACAASEQELCVPDDWLPDGLQAAPASCRSWANGEGRCLPNCLPGLDPTQLPVSDCGSGKLCAPCFDPLSGDRTAACGLGPDPGPTEPPVTFASCCESDGEVLGRCLPVPLLSSEDADRLPVDSCNSRSERCVPNRLIDDPDGGFQGCRAALEDGACIPGCMLSRTEYAILQQRSCPDGMRCAPCSTLEREGVDCP